MENENKGMDITQVLSIFGTAKLTPVFKIIVENWKDIVKLYKCNMAITKIAEQYDIPPEAIRNALLKTRIHQPYSKLKRNSEIAQQLTKVLLKKLTETELREFISLPDSSGTRLLVNVRKALKEKGIK